jgi:hypothetical protein
MILFLGSALAIMLFVWAWSHVLAGRRSANRTEFDEAIVAIRANEIFRLRGGTHGKTERTGRKPSGNCASKPSATRDGSTPWPCS